MDRLIQETVATSSQSFSYDPNGNRTQDGSGAYSYVSASNRLSNAAQGAISIDAAGNTLTDQGGVRSFTYNNAGHLTQVTIGGISTHYTYNAQRQRTKKATSAGTTVYHYDLSGNLITETNPDGTLIRDYVYADSTPLAKIEAGETVTYLHTDHLQTPRLATNEQGTKVWSWEGNAFGETLPNEDADNDSILTKVNLRFPGQYFDQESGLHYNWNRYYDPRTGRYISSDPIGLEGGPNLYAYAYDNPLVFIDPDGLCPPVIDTGQTIGKIWRDRCVRNGKFSSYEGQYRTQFIGTLIATEGNCDCGQTTKTCVYNLVNYTWQRRTPCGGGAFSPWVGGSGQARILRAPVDCKTGQFDLKGFSLK